MESAETPLSRPIMNINMSEFVSLVLEPIANEDSGECDVADPLWGVGRRGSQSSRPDEGVHNPTENYEKNPRTWKVDEENLPDGGKAEEENIPEGWKNSK